jgi:hypothetical protein
MSLLALDVYMNRYRLEFVMSKYEQFRFFVTLECCHNTALGSNTLAVFQQFSIPSN